MTVLDKHLQKTGGDYIVGDKFTYADLAFIPWNWLVPMVMPEGFEKEVQKDCPTYWKWWTRVSERPAIEKVKKDREAATAKNH